MKTGLVISEFKPREAQKDRVWLLLGSRNTGKSVMLKDLLYHTQHGTDMVMGMTQTMSTGNMFKTIMPPGLVYSDGYDYAKADVFLQQAAALAQKGKVRHSTLVMDDVIFDTKVLKSKTQQNLHLNGRHYHTSIFNTSQFSMLVPTTIRANCDYIVALKETVRANRRRLYEHYFGVFPSFLDFEKVFLKCTADFGAMVLDRTQSSGDTEKLISFYRASPEIPPFRMGRKVYWDMSRRIQRQAEAEKEVEPDGSVLIIH